MMVNIALQLHFVFDSLEFRAPASVLRNCDSQWLKLVSQLLANSVDAQQQQQVSFLES